MAETLMEYQTPITAADGTQYRARAVGAEVRGGNWQAWIEFVPVNGGEAVRSPRETTQPNRTDTVYWATGLTSVYLEGALNRALTPIRVAASPVVRKPIFDEPASGSTAASTGETTVSVLDPFSVYEKGEALLRRQLSALSAWHLVNIIVDYELSDESRAVLNATPAPALVDAIVQRVRETVRVR
jgi:hypothetical protein